MNSNLLGMNLHIGYIRLEVFHSRSHLRDIEQRRDYWRGVVAKVHLAYAVEERGLLLSSRGRRKSNDRICRVTLTSHRPDITGARIARAPDCFPPLLNSPKIHTQFTDLTLIVEIIAECLSENREISAPDIQVAGLTSNMEVNRRKAMCGFSAR